MPRVKIRWLMQSGNTARKKIQQWDRLNSPETDPVHSWSPDYDKGAAAVQWGKDSLFNKQC